MLFVNRSNGPWTVPREDGSFPRYLIFKTSNFSDQFLKSNISGKDHSFWSNLSEHFKNHSIYLWTKLHLGIPFFQIFCAKKKRQ